MSNFLFLVVKQTKVEPGEIRIEDRESIHVWHTAHTISFDVVPTEVDLASIATRLVEAEMFTLSRGVEFRRVLCFDCEETKPLDYLSRARVFWPSTNGTYDSDEAPTGARAFVCFDEFITLNIAHNRLHGRQTLHALGGGVSSFDLNSEPTRRGAKSAITLRTESNLYSYWFPQFQELYDEIPGIGGELVFDDLGKAKRHAPRVGAAFASNVSDRAAARRHAKVYWEPRQWAVVALEQAFQDLRVAWAGYEHAMDTFKHQWGNGEVPNLERALDALEKACGAWKWLSWLFGASRAMEPVFDLGSYADEHRYSMFGTLSSALHNENIESLLRRLQFTWHQVEKVRALYDLEHLPVTGAYTGAPGDRYAYIGYGYFYTLPQVGVDLIYSTFADINDALTETTSTLGLLQVFMRPDRPKRTPNGGFWGGAYANESYGYDGDPVEYAQGFSKFFFFEFKTRDRDPYFKIEAPGEVAVTLPIGTAPPVDRRPPKITPDVRQLPFPWLLFWQWFEPLLPSWIGYIIDAADLAGDSAKIQKLFEKFCGDTFEREIEEESKRFARDQLEKMWEREFKEVLIEKIERTVEEIGISELESEIEALIE